MRHHANTLVYYFTSEIGITSLQGTKPLAPKCPLFGGFTVYIPTAIIVKPLVLVFYRFCLESEVANGTDFDPHTVTGPMFLHEVGGNIGETD